MCTVLSVGDQRHCGRSEDFRKEGKCCGKDVFDTHSNRLNMNLNKNV